MAAESWGAAEAEEVHAAALELYRQVGQTSQLFPLVWGHWQYRLGRADYRAAHDLALRLSALAGELNEASYLLLACQAMAQTNWLSGRFVSVPESAEAAIALYVPEQHHALAASYGGHDPVVGSRCCLALSLWILGRPDQAVRTSQEAIALAQTLDHRYSVVFSLLFDAMLQHHRRNADGVRRQTEAAIELAEKQNWWAVVLRSWAGALRGWALVEQAKDEDGIILLREALEGMQSARFESLRPYFLALLAESFMTKGDSSAGLEVLADALEIVERTGEGYIEAELHRLKGECLADSQAKEACFAQAIDVARRQRAASYELRAVMSLSRLYIDRGQHRFARQMVADLYSSFTEGFDTQDLRDASALVQSLS